MGFVTTFADIPLLCRVLLVLVFRISESNPVVCYPDTHTLLPIPCSPLQPTILKMIPHRPLNLGGAALPSHFAAELTRIALTAH